MTNAQLFLSVGIPSLLVILSWVSNNTRLNALEADLKGEIRDIRTEIRDIRGEIGDVRGDIKQFYMTLGKHDEAIDMLNPRSRKNATLSLLSTRMNPSLD